MFTNSYGWLLLVGFMEVDDVLHEGNFFVLGGDFGLEFLDLCFEIGGAVGFEAAGIDEIAEEVVAEGVGYLQEAGNVDVVGAEVVVDGGSAEAGAVG